MAVLKDYWNTGEDGIRNIYSTYQAGMVFAASETYLVDHVKLKLNRVGSTAYTAHCALYTTSGEPALPDTLLATIDKAKADLPTPADWATFDFSEEGITLTSGVKYAIVFWQTPAAGYANRIDLSWEAPGSYANGYAVWYMIPWEVDVFDSDYMFEVWGDAAEDPGAIAGSSTGQSSITANIKTTANLAGSVTGAASIITNLAGTQKLVGSLTPIVSTIVKLLVPTTVLVGSVTSTASTTGNLKTIQELIGALAGECGVAPGTEGNLTSVQKLVGFISGVSGAEANLISASDLSGYITSTVSVTANLIIAIRPLSGSVTSTSTIVVNLKTVQEIAGELAGECGVAPGIRANLTGVQKLVASISVQSIVSGIFFVKSGIQFQYYKTEGVDDNYILLDSPTKKLGQTFPVLYRHEIYRVDLKLFKVGNPGIITIEIRENDGTGAEYYPSGAIVASGMFDGDLLTTDSGGEWKYISLNSPGWLEIDLAVGVNKEYGIVISCAGADSSNKVGWRYDDTSSVFSDGRWCYYDGADWSQEVGQDFMFGEWGHRPNLFGNILLRWENTALTCSVTIIDYDPEAPFAGGEYEFTIIGTAGYNDNAPISMFETGHDGNMALTFRNDFYYRIHIYEIHAGDAPIDLGLILSDIDQDFWVWNAYLTESKTLDDITIVGVLSLAGISIPTTFAPMQAEKCTGTILKEGLPEYKAVASFDFGAEGIIDFIIIGMRVVTLFWRPENSVREMLDWRTEILRAKDGIEQRIKLRQTPRQIFGLRFVIETEKMNTWFDSILHTWQKRAWGIPLWTECVEHTADITAGDLTITVDTTYADFRADSYAIIWKSELEYEVVSISTKTDTTLTLSSVMQNSFTGVKLIMPLRIAYMVSKNASQRYNSPASVIEALFAVSDNVDITGYSSAVEYDSLEVLTVPSFMDAIHREESDGQIEVSDFATGTFKVRSDKEFNLLSQNHVFLNDSKEACWKFRQFLHWLNGRQKAVLIPTFRADLNQVGTIGSSDTFFYVENIKLASNLGANTLRTYVGFYFPDKTLIIRKITAIDETDATKEKITINALLGQEVIAGSCKICFVDKCRLTSDRVEFDWLYAHRNECKTNLTRVP